jgi:hypothetical protein
LVEAMMTLLREWVGQAKKDCDEMWHRYAELAQTVRSSTGRVLPYASAAQPRVMERTDMQSCEILDVVFMALGPTHSCTQMPPLSPKAYEVATGYDNAVDEDTIGRLLLGLDGVVAIFQACSTFWTSMDGVVRDLISPEECSRCVASYVKKPQAESIEVETRFLGYHNFWESLAHLCNRYCQDHEVMSKTLCRL